MTTVSLTPITSRIPGVTIVADVVTRSIGELDAACAACDGSFDTVEVVRKAADALQSASAECFDHANSVAECTRRVCDRLT